MIVMGAGWGLTQPLSKIIVSEGYRHFGLIFWQFAIGAVVIGAIVLIRGRGLPLHAAALRRYLMVALIGTILPNSASYEAVRYLPAGLMSVVLSMVPMLAFPVALALGNDSFSVSRLLGLSLGFIGVLLIALPDTSLPDPGMVPWLLLALAAPLFYAMEGNFVAKWGMGGTDPFQLLFGASVLGAVLILPLAVVTGHWIAPVLPLGAPDIALIASAVLHVFAYTTYVWLVGQAGPSFAVQVAYLVTGFGVLWSMLLLGERFSLWIWAAMAVMLLGVALVQPRMRDDAHMLGLRPEKI
ncbi:MAG: drug/metabolite transporter (DMT)-like permease [Pseudorhodobacter sp.]|jgi:drug/metabolite transporter (DMT)-like permease